MQHPFPVCIIQREKTRKTHEASPIVQQQLIFDKLQLCLTVFIKMSSIDALLQAAEYIERRERGMRNKWQDLPDELILKILSYSEVIDLVSCGQVSKRTRNISRDSSLWVMANLKEKFVKTELLELILCKGCKILNISDSTIVGSLSSSIKSQLRVLNLSQSAWDLLLPGAVCYNEETIIVLEQLLFSCCSLQQLEMKGFCITSKMTDSICKNGKTLQALNLDNSIIYESTNPYHYTWYRLDNTVLKGNLQTIIKSCQELKEVNLSYLNANGDKFPGLSEVGLELLAKNITPNIEKLNLENHDLRDDQVKILLSRCKKIKILSLNAYWLTDDSLTYIRDYLNLTLEELSLDDKDDDDGISFASYFKLKSMSRLKILKLYHKRDDCEEIQNLRQHLPHVKIQGNPWGPH